MTAIAGTARLAAPCSRSTGVEVKAEAPTRRAVHSDIELLNEGRQSFHQQERNQHAEQRAKYA